MPDLKQMRYVLGYFCALLVIFGIFHRIESPNDVPSVPQDISDRRQLMKQSNAITQRMDDKSLAGSINTVTNQFYREYQRRLCEMDNAKINSLTVFDHPTIKKIFNSKKDTDYVNNFFHEFIQSPHVGYCKEIKRFGGHYNSNCKYTDGQKFVCMDDLLKDVENNECLIYSFGVANDWTFEDIMDSFGCTIYAFDASVDYPARRGKNIHFEKIFVGTKDEEAKETLALSTILSRHGHQNKKISYLKMDIEGNELNGLPLWHQEGFLQNVQQIGFEFHLNDDIAKTNDFIRTLKSLYFHGNYRLISYDANGCWKNIEPKNHGHVNYYNLAEIVLMKVDWVNNEC